MELLALLLKTSVCLCSLSGGVKQIFQQRWVITNCIFYNFHAYRTSLKNDLIPELKKSIDDLKEECYAILDETAHSPVISLESFVSACVCV